MSIRGLYAITDPALMPGELLELKVAAALQGGCRLIQYRNKTASYSHQVDEARGLNDLCHQYQAALIVNDNLDLAVSVQAAGVHLGQTDTDIAVARKKVSSEFIIGATCHASLSLASVAQQKGADYLAFGRFFPSRTKASAPPADPNIIQQAKQTTDLPVVAIGGITEDNVQTLIDVGANGVAMCFELFNHDDPQKIRAKTERISAMFYA